MSETRTVTAAGGGSGAFGVVGCWVAVLVLGAGGPGAAVQTRVVGGAASPWSAAGDLQAADATSEPGWLQPIRITLDQNLARGDAQRTALAYSLQPSIQSLGGLENMIDGDSTTAFQMTLEATVGSSVILDLGAVLPVSLIKFYPRQDELHRERFLRAYQVYVTDRALSPQGQILWDLVAPNWDNSQSVVRISIPNRFVRDVRIQAATNLQWEIAEWEVYGQGFAPSATFTSHPLDLGGPANFGALSWAATQDPTATVNLFTRSGTDPTPYIYYRLDRPEEGVIDTVEVDQAAYERLAETSRYQEFDIAHWSFWSAPYPQTGSAAVVSPAPRRYFQFQAQFESSAFTGRAKLDSVALEYSAPPVAQRVVGEVSPGLVAAGQTTEFTYAVSPEISAGDTGFDALRLSTPLAAQIRDLRIDGVSVAYEADVGDQELTVRFPRIRTSGSCLELVFDCQILVYGTVFDGTVFDSQTQEVPQDVVEGNASPALTTNRLSVGVATLDDRVLAGAQVTPAAFSPNGDGINDEVTIRYYLQKLLLPGRVVLAIYDLAGRRLWERTVFQDSGVYTIAWNGVDASGRLAAPGIYTFTLTVHTASGQHSTAGTFGLAY